MIVAPWLFWAALSAAFAAHDHSGQGQPARHRSRFRLIDSHGGHFPTLAAFMLLTGKWQT